MFVVPTSLKRYQLVIFLSVIYALFVAWGIQLFRDASVIEYPDSADYHSVSIQSLTTPDFWAWKRPFTTPLMWRLSGETPGSGKGDIQSVRANVPVIYTTLSLFSWGILAFSLALVIRTSWLKVTAFIFILGLGLSRMIFFWNWTLLSESPFISFSVLLLSIGIILIYWIQTNPPLSRRKQFFTAFGIGAVIFLWSFTRDTNMFVAISFAGILSLWFGVKWEAIHHKVLVGTLIAAFACTAISQMLTVQAGRRWEYSFVNVLGQRILTNSGYTNFFASHGLPMDASVTRFSGQWANSYNGDWSGFKKWLKTDARPTYIKFLLTNPTFTFLEPIHHRRDLVDGDWSNYGKSTVNNQAQNTLTRFVWPSGPYLTVMTIVAIALAFTSFIRRNISRYTLLAFALLISVVPGVLSTWHGDAMEIVRHSIGNSLQLRLALALIIVFTLDSLLNRRSGFLAKS